MSKLLTYLEEWDITLLNSDLDEIRNIVLEEAGFKWIPVSERLPEVEDWYQVTVENMTKPVRAYYYVNRKEWFITSKEYSYGDIIAWMPRPKPYQP